MVDIRELKQPTIRLIDPEYDAILLVGKQEEAVRKYLSDHKIETLRGFHWEMKRNIWSYYDVIKESYK